MSNLDSLSNLEALIDAAATWGRVAEREGYGEAGFPVIGNSFGRGPGTPIDKSALLQRLLAGKPPLIFRPPTIFSYPWYEIIENSQQKYNVLVGGVASLASWFSAADSETQEAIVVNGAFWQIKKTLVEDEDYIVTWGRYPMEWRLSLERVPKIVCELESKEENRNSYYQLKASLTQKPIEEVIEADKERRANKPKTKESSWEEQWILRRIGLSGWPFAGDVLDVMQKEFACIARDDDGEAVLFFEDKESDSDDPTGEAWIRIEHDSETNTSRYVSMLVSARSKLEQKIQKECGEYLKSLSDLAMSRGGDVFVMDRSEPNKEILRLFRTRARPEKC